MALDQYAFAGQGISLDSPAAIDLFPLSALWGGEGIGVVPMGSEDFHRYNRHGQG